MMKIPEAHLPPHKSSRLDVAGLQGFPLTEKNMPFKKSRGPGPLLIILNYLDVEKSPRYQPGRGVTQCDAYAEDYCYLAGVYLPKVFWFESALSKIKEGKSINVDYGKTVRELNANSIHMWLHNFGGYFGWEEIDPTSQQEAVNCGAVGLITGLNKNPRKPGHVTVVIPENMEKKSLRKHGTVIMPLQSESGAVPRAVFCSAWWDMSIFKEHSFWINKGE